MFFNGFSELGALSPDDILPTLQNQTALGLSQPQALPAVYNVSYDTSRKSDPLPAPCECLTGTPVINPDGSCGCINQTPSLPQVSTVKNETIVTTTPETKPPTLPQLYTGKSEYGTEKPVAVNVNISDSNKPAEDDDNLIFGIEPKYLLIGGVIVGGLFWLSSSSKGGDK